jgi:hypothetical protein
MEQMGFVEHLDLQSSNDPVHKMRKGSRPCLQNSLTMNGASSQLFDNHTLRSVRPGTLRPVCQRRHSGQSHDEKIGSPSGKRSRTFAAPDATHPVVEITPSDIVKRRFMSWRRTAAEVVQTTSQERIE